MTSAPSPAGVGGRETRGDDGATAGEEPGPIAVALGTRPEAIKLAPVIRALERAGERPHVIATGQHRELLDPILAELEIAPEEDLTVLEQDQTLGRLSARVLERFEDLLQGRRPRLLVVQGDTTSTAMSALAAFYQGVPVAHVEAGLRTHCPRNPFPEELNRKLVSCVADVHFAPTPRARANLLREGVSDAAIHVVGNTVVDALVHARDERLPGLAPPRALSPVLEDPRAIVLVTAHRRESFGADLAETCEGLATLARTLADQVQVVFPVHRNPNVRAQVERRLGRAENVRLLAPLSYLTFVRLMLRARIIVTDSGGIQEEAAFLGIPVLVTRRTSERMEAVEAGVARLVEPTAEALVTAAKALVTDPEAYRAQARPTPVFGDGRAAERIADVLVGRSA